MTPGLLYLAAPYSHPCPALREMRFHAINRAAGDLMRRGCLVFSPISHSHPIARDCRLDGDFGFWRDWCLTMLAQCDRVIILPLWGWRDSRGVRAEVEFARSLGMVVEFYCPKIK